MNVTVRADVTPHENVTAAGLCVTQYTDRLDLSPARGQTLHVASVCSNGDGLEHAEASVEVRTDSVRKVELN